jgi:hypothetical protein
MPTTRDLGDDEERQQAGTGLLRSRRERPSDRGAAEKGDEIPGRLC